MIVAIQFPNGRIESRRLSDDANLQQVELQAILGATARRIPLHFPDDVGLIGEDAIKDSVAIPDHVQINPHAPRLIKGLPKDQVVIGPLIVCGVNEAGECCDVNYDFAPEDAARTDTPRQADCRARRKLLGLTPEEADRLKAMGFKWAEPDDPIYMTGPTVTFLSQPSGSGEDEDGDSTAPSLSPDHPSEPTPNG